MSCLPEPENAPSLARTDTLAESVVILLVMTVLQRLVGFARGVLFCRWLEPEQLGQWDLALGFLSFAAPLAMLGLPGSFGRYSEYFRQRGQLHLFLARVGIVSSVLGMFAVAAVLSRREWFSQLIFGRDDKTNLVLYTALSLAALMAHNFLSSLFVAVRQYRVVTLLQFLQSVGFAVFSGILLFAWRLGPQSVIMGFAFSSLAASLFALPRLRQLWRPEAGPHTAVGQREFWLKLAPFAVWVWTTNNLTNLFEVIDRYMLIHHSGMTDEIALQAVGNYHSSRIVPLLFVSVAALLGSIITPHLSHDWEAGKRVAVSDRLALVLKLLAFSLLGVSTLVLLGAPLLFEAAFRGKFSGGMAVLPWTLTYCSWFGLLAVAQNYLWCAEKAWLGSLALAIGLALSIAANSVLLPIFGLQGAVWTAAGVNAVALSVVFAFNRALGMKIDRGLCLLTLSLAALGGGLATATAMLALVVVGVSASDALVNRREKQIVFAALAQYRTRLTTLVSQSRTLRLLASGLLRRA